MTLRALIWCLHRLCLYFGTCVPAPTCRWMTFLAARVLHPWRKALKIPFKRLSSASWEVISLPHFSSYCPVVVSFCCVIHYFFHLLFSCRNICSFFPFWVCSWRFLFCFSFCQALCAGMSGEVGQSGALPVDTGNAEVNTVISDRITANSSLSIWWDAPCTVFCVLLMLCYFNFVKSWWSHCQANLCSCTAP